MTSIEPFDADIDAGRRRRRSTPTIARKEVTAMNRTMTSYIFAVHAERIGRYRAEARAERLRRELRTDRSLRRAFGRTLVRFGERIAADPDERFQPAASR